MAAKKKPAKKLSPVDKTRIQKALKNVEDKLLINYKSAAKVSGKSLAGGTKKLKANFSKAKKKIEVEVRKNPAGATVAAAVLGAIAGAFIMSKMRKK
jgi:hypothetical protein